MGEAMPLADRIHGAHQHPQGPDTPGIVLEHGRGYDRFVGLCFGGRRSAVFNKLARLSGAEPGDRVLDVGCGTGYLTRRLARIVAPGGGARQGSAVGIDASAGMLAQARRSASAPNCDFALGVAERLEFGDGEFDVVASTLMLHHLPPELRGQALREMHRVLRPGGRLLIGEFRPPSSALGKHAIAALTGSAMQEDQRTTLPGLIRDAGFERLETGDLRPWITYVRAVRE
jgi:ubiquinone/menaquinone biosynthesis C-methylase UbiE